MDHDTFDPSFQTAFSTELTYSFQDLGEGGDQDIFGLRLIPDIPAAQRVHFRGKCIIKVLLGDAVATQTAFNELFFVHRQDVGSKTMFRP